MRFTFRQLQVFHACAECLHFSKAAKQLHMTAPAVHKQIANLENTLGAALFKVIGKKVFLTHKGITLKNKVAPLLATIDSFESTVQSELNDTPAPIRLSFEPGLANKIFPLTQLHAAQHPEQIFHFVSHFNLDDILDGLTGNHVDAAFTTKSLSAKQFTQIGLFDLCFYKVAHKDYNAAHSHLMILPHYETELLEQGAHPLFLDTYASVKEAVLAKIGAGVLPHNLIDATPELQILNTTPVQQHTIYFTTLKGNMDASLAYFKKYALATYKKPS
jgi:DNA-binding transcriptional LysR family regulator